MKTFVLFCLLMLFSCVLKTPYGQVDFNVDAEVWIKLIELLNSRSGGIRAVEFEGRTIYICPEGCPEVWGEGKATFLTVKEIENADRIFKETGKVVFKNSIGDVFHVE